MLGTGMEHKGRRSVNNVSVDPVNRFDERAATWDDDPAHLERARVVAAAIRDAVPLDSSVRLLEYGAGTGLVSQALSDAVGPITVADTSAGMRKVMEDKVAAGVITDGRVWDLDLAAAALPESEERFDLIITVMALHHLSQVDPVLSNFATLLVQGAHLAIVDLDEEDGTFHGDGLTATMGSITMRWTTTSAEPVSPTSPSSGATRSFETGGPTPSFSRPPHALSHARARILAGLHERRCSRVTRSSAWLPYRRVRDARSRRAVRRRRVSVA